MTDKMKSREIHIISSLCKKLTNEELSFIIQNSNDKFIHLLAEIIYNCTHNSEIFGLMCKKKQFKRIRYTNHEFVTNVNNFHHREKLADNKTLILRALKTKKVESKRRIFKKQAGAGILTGLLSLLVGILPTILRK